MNLVNFFRLSPRSHPLTCRFILGRRWSRDSQALNGWIWSVMSFDFFVSLRHGDVAWLAWGMGQPLYASSNDNDHGNGGLFHVLITAATTTIKQKQNSPINNERHPSFSTGIDLKNYLIIIENHPRRFANK